MDVSGSSTVGGDLDVQGSSTVGGDLAVNGAGSFIGPLIAPSVTGTNELCIGGDCRSSWPSGNSGTFQLVLNPNGAVPDENTVALYRLNHVVHRHITNPNTDLAIMLMPINGIPNGATITNIVCSSVVVNAPASPSIDFRCALFKFAFGGAVTQVVSTPVHSTSGNPVWQIFGSGAISMSVDSASHLVLSMQYDPNGNTCGTGVASNCGMGAARITYTVP